MDGRELQLVAELVVPADVGMLSLCRTTLVGVVSGLPITDRRLDDLKLVLSEVCGAAMRPSCSRSDMTLRIEAGDRVIGSARDRLREPTGSPVSR